MTLATTHTASLSRDRPTVVILAGGRSTRMGTDKALLDVEGQPLLTRTCQMAQQLGPVVVVTPWSDRYRDLLPDGCRCIAEPQTGDRPAGPLHGLRYGFPHVTTEWLLLLACDLPRFSAAALVPYVTQLSQLPATTQAWLPRSTHRWEPLCGFYRATCQDSLSVAWERGDRSFQQWLKTLVVQELALGDRSILFNCNTPEDWARIAKV